MKTLWLFGPSGAGKTTIGKLLLEEIKSHGYRGSLIDGDELRKTICADLGFCYEDRMIQAKRAAHVAKMINDTDAWAVVCLITPFKEARDEANKIVESQMIYLKSSVETRIKRDPKGLYAKAVSGNLEMPLTGYDGRFDEPDQNEATTISTDSGSPQEIARDIINSILQ